MGNYFHKYLFQHPETENEETNEQSTPVNKEFVNDNNCTPVTQKILPIDPRSVTIGIDRTPIEVTTPVGRNKKMLSAIPRHLQPKPYLETDLDEIMGSPRKCIPEIEDERLDYLNVESLSTNMQLTPTVNSSMENTPVDENHYNVLGLDPRSPAADFNRTPMIMPRSVKLLRARFKHNMHNQGSYDTDVYPTISYCETSSQFAIPEIQALPDLAVCKLGSMNLFENDNDKLSESDSSNSSQASTMSTDSRKNESDHESKSSKVDNYSNYYTKKGIKNKEITGSDGIKIWRDSASDLIKTQDVQDVEEKVSKLPTSEVIITFDDDTPLKSSKRETNKKPADINNKKRAIKSEIKIVPDQKKTFNSNDKNEPTKVRTPLANRSNNGLIQTNSGTNTPQVIRNKGLKSKVSQENASPHKNYVSKHKLACKEWDPNSTVII